jgi:signal transduction histidine kinase
VAAAARAPELAEAVEEVRAVEAATKRCRDIVRGLLDFSRKPETPAGGSRARVPRRIDEAVGRVFGFLRHDLDRRGIALCLELDRSGAAVLAEENQLEQVIVNLAANAIDAMPHGGRIVVRTSVEGAAPARSAVLVFSDTGSGIAPDVLPRIFEPFFTTKAAGKGTGLGLAIAARIVEEHGGAISVESEPGRGTTFTVRLPVHEPSPEEAVP